MFNKAAVAFILSVLWAARSYAGIPVDVEATSRDAVGQRLVFYFKENIKASSSFQLSLDEQTGFQVSIITLNPDDDNQSYSTVYSAVWKWNDAENLLPYYMHSRVGTCGSNRVKECAVDLLVETNNQLERLARLIKAARGE